MRSPCRSGLDALVLALLALLVSTGASAKTPPFTQADCADPTLELRLTSQADVDSFPCTTVAGDLAIKRVDPASISSLSPGLDKLTSVGGQLRLGFDDTGSPTTLDGLNNLTDLGSLDLRAQIDGQPDQLKDISALGGLTSLGPRNCQPAPDPTRCDTQITIFSSDITQLPAWNIAGGTALEVLRLTGLPLADPTQLDSLPLPTKRLTLEGLPLDTDQPGQLTALARIASAAQGQVTLNLMANVKALPSMPQTEDMALRELGLPDLGDITQAAFPKLASLDLNGLAGIDPAELAPIRNIASINLASMPGLTGPNPLAGLTGGAFRRLLLDSLSGVGTLTDLSSVTDLEVLSIRNLDALADLDGLQNLTAVSQRLELVDNANLQDLDGLSGVNATLQEVSVQGNVQLTDITGLAGITGVSDSVLVFANAVIECDVLVKSRLNPQPQSANDYFVDPACVYAAPTLISDATALDFGSGPIGSTIDRSVTFQNGISTTTGSILSGSISTTVDISAVSISGDSLGEYSVLSEDCTPGKAENPLTGGSTRNSCTVTVRFTVTQVGVDNAQLDLTYTTSESSTPQKFPVTLHAAGTGVTGDQLIPNTNLDFGPVELGASKTGTITIDNSGGSGPLSVSALAVTGPDFTLTNNSCGNSYPQTVPVGSQCAVTIRFTPSALNARSGLFTMDSDGATSPDNVNLLGSGVKAPAPIPSISSIDFGDVVRGTTAVQPPLTVRNEGPLSSLPLDQLSASGDFAVQADTCSGTTLAPAGQAGDSCTVNVVFAPTTVGPATGTLTIPGASGFPAASVALSGNGLQPASLTASPTYLAFGTQTGPTTLSVTVTNIGAPGQDAQLGTASVTGTLTPVQFAIDSDTCSGNTLASQATCQITVEFDPFQADADTGTLDIPYNSGQSLSVALSGRGSDPVDYVSPSSLSFSVAIGSTSAAQTVTVTDNSGIALDISSVRISQGQGFTVQNDTCSGTTVSPGGSCTFDVTFTAIARGHVVSTVEVVSNSASSPDEVIVDGLGLAPPEVHLSEPTVDFGPVAPGSSSSEIVTVTNYGDEDLVIGTLVLGPPPEFSISADGCSGTTLAKGARCTFTVDYAPSTTGTVTGTVTLPSNATSSPTILNLVGGGVAPIPTAIPTLSEWARLSLLALIALIGIAAIRRRSGLYGQC